METQTALQTFSTWIGIVGGLVGIVGGATGVLALVRNWINDHDHVQSRLRPVDDGHGRPKAFVLEVVNLGRRAVCITFVGFARAPYRRNGIHNVSSIRYGNGPFEAPGLPAVLEPGRILRFRVLPADLLGKEPVRPVVRLATQKRFLGPVVERPDEHFDYHRKIDVKSEDPLVEKLHAPGVDHVDVGRKPGRIEAGLFVLQAQPSPPPPLGDERTDRAGERGDRERKAD